MMLFVAQFGVDFCCVRMLCSNSNDVTVMCVFIMFCLKLAEWPHLGHKLLTRLSVCVLYIRTIFHIRKTFSCNDYPLKPHFI